MPTNLPTDFPRMITTKLQAAVYNGQQQLWAPFSHGGKIYKIVISYGPHSGITCQPGETWTVKVNNSPNGHIVFCRPWEKVLTASGLHPIVERATWQLNEKLVISIQKVSKGAFSEKDPPKLGLLGDVRVANDTLTMSFTEAALGYEDSTCYEARSHIDPFTIEVPLADTQWHGVVRDGSSFTWDCYDVVFLDFVTWDQVIQFLDNGQNWEVDDPNYDSDYNYEDAREDFLRREEEDSYEDKY